MAGLYVKRSRGEGFAEHYRIYAQFSGVDANHDNVIELDEIVYVHPDGFSLTPSSCSPPQMVCDLSAFTYSAANGVTFSGHYSFSYVDEVSNMTIMDRHTFVARDYFLWEHFEQGNLTYWVRYGFDARTVETVGLAPVPEPSTYVMLGTGLLLLGASSRRRKSG